MGRYDVLSSQFTEKPDAQQAGGRSPRSGGSTGGCPRLVRTNHDAVTFISTGRPSTIPRRCVSVSLARRKRTNGPFDAGFSSSPSIMPHGFALGQRASRVQGASRPPRDFRPGRPARADSAGWPPRSSQIKTPSAPVFFGEPADSPRPRRRGPFLTVKGRRSKRFYSRPEPAPDVPGPR
jgi:hypothetical protein